MVTRIRRRVTTTDAWDGTVTAATLSALLAFDSETLPEGLVVKVAAYGATGYGGGYFYWDSTSTAASDGGVVFVPDDLASALTTETLNYANFSENASISLAHSGIVFGSVALQVNNTQTLGSLWLHGHSAVSPRHGVGGSTTGRDTALLDHANGKVIGDGFVRLRKIIGSNTETHATLTSRTATLSYKYATGPGRWIRILEEDRVTPAMFGGKPDDGTFDNGPYICWALNYLNSQSAIKTLWFDDNYTAKTMPGEIYTGITIKGLGMNTPCLTYMGDQGGGTGGIADFLKSIYLDSAQVANNTDTAYYLGLHRPTFIQYDEAGDYGFEDFCFDGNYANNMYFLDNVGSAWDITAETGLVSSLLRETPSHSGLHVSTQDGRVIAADKRFFMRRVAIYGMLGSCIAYANGGTMSYETLRLGNSVSGRVLYGGQGSGRDITIFGFTRSSYWTPYSGKFGDIQFEDLAVNPWPANAVARSLIGYRGENYDHEADDLGLSAIVQERYGQRQFLLDGGSAVVDLAATEITHFLQPQGDSASLAGWKLYGPTSGTFNIINLPSGGVTGAVNLSVRGLTFFNRSTSGARLFNLTGTGYCAKACISDVFMRDDEELSRPASLATPPSSDFANINMDPHPGGDVPPIDEQVYEFRDIRDDVVHQFLFQLEGGGNASAIRTKIKCHNCSWKTVQNKLVKSVETDVTFSARLQIELVDCVFDLFDPGAANRGAANVTDPWIAMTTMRGCRTTGNSPRFSEIDEVVTYTIVSSSPGAGQLLDTTVNGNGYIDIPLNLIWGPQSYRVTPLSANAVTLGITKTEIAYPTTTPPTSDKTLPRARIYLPTVTAGQVLSYAVSAAVAPPSS